MDAQAQTTRGPPSRLQLKERARTDPEFREGFQILLVSAGNRVFLSALDSEAVFSGRKRPDFFHEQGVHEHRSVDANKSVSFELPCHYGNRLTQKIGTRITLKHHAAALSLNGYHVGQIDEENPSPDLDGHPERLRLRNCLPSRKAFRQFQ